jgi:hypothetical protein
VVGLGSGPELLQGVVRHLADALPGNLEEFTDPGERLLGLADQTELERHDSLRAVAERLAVAEARCVVPDVRGSSMTTTGPRDIVNVLDDSILDPEDPASKTLDRFFGYDRGSVSAGAAVDVVGWVKSSDHPASRSFAPVGCTDPTTVKRLLGQTLGRATRDDREVSRSRAEGLQWRLPKR